MPDAEKVIKGLEWCMNEKHDCYREKGCPYENDGEDIGCKYALHRDALALLKAQMPRVMTLKELDALGDNAIVWLECLYAVDGMKTTTLQPAIYQSESSGPEEDGYYCVVSSWSHSGFYHKDNYGGDWRCWTSRPTDEQRETTPWNGKAERLQEG